MPTATATEKPAAYGAEPVRKQNLINPRFWHGMLPGDFLREFVRHRGRVSPRGAIASATALGAGFGHLVGKGVQHLTYGRRIREMRLEKPPLFVLGHWRSGTTLLHELLIPRPGEHLPTTYACFVPHHFLSTEAWFTRLFPWLLPKKRPMDNVDMAWDRPQEDEFAIMALGMPSPYRSWMFPLDGPVDADWLTLDDVTDDQRRRWGEALRYFVHAVSVGRQGRVVLKSPPHTARVRTLLKVFPGRPLRPHHARPAGAVPLDGALVAEPGDGPGLQRKPDHYDWIEEEVFSNLQRMYAAFERDRDLIPAGRLAELRYEDLVADPMDGAAPRLRDARPRRLHRRRQRRDGLPRREARLQDEPLRVAGRDRVARARAVGRVRRSVRIYVVN